MPFKTKEAQALYFKKYNQINRAKKAEQGRKSFLKIRFGITPEEYDQMLVDQNFSCAICKKHISKFNKRLAIDHCHETGAVRGLLCSNCNAGLGLFKENPVYLNDAIKYLELVNTGQ